ncbi:MAG: SpoIIE family protein phosphatase [Desulfobacterales bacterium]|nr:MAG: SpoIIE family protein phosphatase [Desulfobacterales bacterium]
MNDLLSSSEVILNSLSDGVYVCDRERRVVFWSKSAERITGWRPEEVVGRLCLEDVLCHEDKDGHRLCGEEHCPLHRAMVTGVITSVPLIVFARGRDGQKIPMQVTTAPIRNEAGEVIGGVETFRDVSPMLLDLERAKEIQASTLRHKLPDDPRLRVSTFFMPYDIVGGDYYAINQLDENRYGFFLADMEGHGVAAGLYTMHLSNLWNLHSRLLTKPAEFAAEVNKELGGVVGRDASFATAVCGVLDARNGALRFTGAGGPPPLIIRANWRVEKLKASGVAFGVVEDVPYQEQTARLEPGDAMLLFSDGAFEIHNALGEQLGVDGFIEILKNLDYPQTQLRMDQLEEELLKFSNEIRLQDDVTIIEIRFGGQPPSR